MASEILRRRMTADLQKKEGLHSTDLTSLVILEEKMGHFMQAEELAKAAIGWNRNNIGACNELIYLLSKKGEQRAAQDLLIKLLSTYQMMKNEKSAVLDYYIINGDVARTKELLKKVQRTPKDSPNDLLEIS